MNCPNCHNHKTQFFFEAQNIHGSRKLSKEKFILLKCVKCGVIFPQVVIDNLYYKKYYPVNYYHSGMIKTCCYNLQKFADNILLLLDDKKLYNKISKEAHTLIIEVWDWNKRADFIYRKVFNNEIQNQN